MGLYPDFRHFRQFCISDRRIRNVGEIKMGRDWSDDGYASDMSDSLKKSGDDFHAFSVIGG